MAIDLLPKDPMMLLSFVNTRLRDDHITLEEFSAQFDVKAGTIEDMLDKIGFNYNNELNRFV